MEMAIPSHAPAVRLCVAGFASLALLAMVAIPILPWFLSLRVVALAFCILMVLPPVVILGPRKERWPAGVLAGVPTLRILAVMPGRPPRV